MELGASVRFSSKVGPDASIVSVDAIHLNSEGDKSLVLVAPTVPGVQTISLSGESLALTQVLTSSLLSGWKSRLGPGDFAVPVPKLKLPSILAHLLREDTQIHTSASEEVSAHEGPSEARLHSFEQMGRSLQQSMLDMSDVVKDIQKEMQVLRGEKSRSSHSADWSLLQGSKVPKSAFKPRMTGLSSGRSLWQGVMDDELEDEDDEEDVPDPQLFSVRKPTLAQHSAGLFNKVPMDPRAQPSQPDDSPDGSVNVDRLIQMKMLKLLQKSKGKRDSADSSSGSSSESLSNDKLKGKGFKGVRKLRRRYHRHPRRLINSYVIRSKEIIGVHHKDQRWGFRDLSMRIKRNFGKMTGLWRCHLILQEIIQLQMADDHVHATALTCQLSKALHQVAVDHGNWETALLLIPLPDAIGDTPFGGDEEELESIHAYMKSLRELKIKASNRDVDKGDKGEDDGAEQAEAAPKKGAKSR